MTAGSNRQPKAWLNHSKKTDLRSTMQSSAVAVTSIDIGRTAAH
jgi:hypothetical protein